MTDKLETLIEQRYRARSLAVRLLTDYFKAAGVHRENMEHDMENIVRAIALVSNADVGIAVERTNHV